MDELSKALGLSIRRHRTGVGLSQAALAEALSLSRSSVTNIECGRQPVSITGLYGIARVLGVPVSDLLPDDPVKPLARGRRAPGVRSLLQMLDPLDDRAAS